MADPSSNTVLALAIEASWYNTRPTAGPTMGTLWRMASASISARTERERTRMNSKHTEIYALSLHDALPIFLALAIEASWYNTRPTAGPTMGTLWRMASASISAR